MQSNHLFGRAVDLADPDGAFYKWCHEEGAQKLEELELWGEEGTKGWTHLQTQPPRSQKRWFLP